MKPILALLLSGLLASCATQAPTPETGEKTASPKTVAGEKPAQPEKIQSQPLKHLAGRKLKPMPDKELNVRTQCNFKDVAGGRGSMDLLVTRAEAKRFVAEVSIPKQGICRFDMRHFEQTAKMPNVVLTDKDSSCTVRMWEQEKGVTVAFNSCQARCDGDAFSYLWPILVDTRNGRCA